MWNQFPSRPHNGHLSDCLSLDCTPLLAKGFIRNSRHAPCPTQRLLQARTPYVTSLEACRSSPSAAIPLHMSCTAHLYIPGDLQAPSCYPVSQLLLYLRYRRTVNAEVRVSSSRVQRRRTVQRLRRSWLDAMVANQNNSHREVGRQRVHQCLCDVWFCGHRGSLYHRQIADAAAYII